MKLGSFAERVTGRSSADAHNGYAGPDDADDGRAASAQGASASQQRHSALFGRRSTAQEHPNVRYIPWNTGEAVNKKFERNNVTTAKYDPYFITFLPLFLFEMFTRMAYFYFLVQACLAWWGTVSPFAPYGSTMALVFVLLVAGIKAIVEDHKRHVEDRNTNRSPCTIMVRNQENGQWEEKSIRWKELKVGDVVKVRDGELFPADLLCFHCDLKERICYVKTTNLDGETNLKVKSQILDDKYYPSDDGDPIQRLLGLTFQLECELPNSNLHSFNGKLTVSGGAPDGGIGSGGLPTGGQRQLPIDIKHMLLRGCLLKNSHSVLGLVVYAGKESRIQMNAAAPPLKVGTFDHFLNIEVSILIIFQLFLCLACAIANYSWREREGFDRYFLAFDSYTEGNVENGFVYTLMTFLTFWILFSYLVPISLFVTLEIVKFIQGFIFINNDIEMIGPDGQNAKCRNSNLNEDLGKVTYVFSDKTGTLTSNEMRLRMAAVKGSPMGDMNRILEDHPDKKGLEGLEFFSARMARCVRALRASKHWKAILAGGGSSPAVLSMMDSVSGPSDIDLGKDAEHFLGYHVFDFWFNLCLCHSLLVEDVDGVATYQGPSPDEVALVDCARQMGFEFVSRSSTHSTISIFGEQHAYETLRVMEFSSERQRMSVIVRCPDGTIKLFCKGSDAIMLGRLREKDQGDPLLSRVHDNLHFFSTKGLRTLVVGTRVLEESVYEQWRQRLEKAELGTDKKLTEQILGEIESELELIGVTAIEDKLQKGVPEAIATLISGGIKVWMITGDKQETAINISVSCRLFSNTEDLLVCNASSKSAAEKLLNTLTDRADAMLATNEPTQLVIDGKTLTHVLEDQSADNVLLMKLATLGSKCSAVCICRASPKQKASMVKMMREFELRQAQSGRRTAFGRWVARKQHNLEGKLLSIGDGANDVAMIQEADLGIGIAGKEGRQAVNNSDYAVSQFRHLTRLLLVHGQLSHYRLRGLIKYSFYKNACFAGVLFYYQIFAGFSGQTLVDDISAAGYNVVFTSLPILFFSLLDKPCSKSTLMRFALTYNRTKGMKQRVFWKSVFHAWVDAAICFFVPFYGLSPRGALSIIDVFSVGKTVFVALLGTVTVEMMIITRYWTWGFVIVTALSYGLVYPYILAWPHITETIFNSWDMAHHGIGETVFAELQFWLALVSANVLTFALRYFERSYKWIFRPDREMILAEWERWSKSSQKRLIQPAASSSGGDDAAAAADALGAVEMQGLQSGAGPAAVLSERQVGSVEANGDLKPVTADLEGDGTFVTAASAFASSNVDANGGGRWPSARSSSMISP